MRQSTRSSFHGCQGNNLIVSRTWFWACEIKTVHNCVLMTIQTTSSAEDTGRKVAAVCAPCGIAPPSGGQAVPVMCWSNCCTASTFALRLYLLMLKKKKKKTLYMFPDEHCLEKSLKEGFNGYTSVTAEAVFMCSYWLWVNKYQFACPLWGFASIMCAKAFLSSAVSMPINLESKC